ncbi:MAG: heme/copper-type cytochrome/quinol oxidase subunit 3 [Verrucomicrobiales bacterium]|jgi:heme/copper-type cytochrome/quinol oxidase subunit 3
MEIPYTVTARSDTGLWNAKIGIWLFLASEVMLFGGLFSSYVYLRMGADFAWPVHELKIIPGFLNTMNLIISSVTVVFAWASLKMRQYTRYKIFMSITLLCSVIFMCIKAYEYSGKFAHYGVTLNDGTILEGHPVDDKISFDDVTAITVTTATSDLAFLKQRNGEKGEVMVKKPVELADVEPVAELPDEFVLDSGNLRKIKKAARSRKLAATRLELSSAPLSFDVAERKQKGYNDTQLTFRDGTTLEGKMTNDNIIFGVDRIDMRMTKDIEKSPFFSFASPEGGNWGEWKGQFLKHYGSTMDEFLREHEDFDKAMALENVEFQRLGLRLATVDPGDHHYPEVVIPRSEKRFYANFTPRYNPYYAIYFLMTGLHGLHVIGGALVMGYMLFFNGWLYKKNPEHLANRVEVAGLFWHFVDLIWIFLFPLYYLF